MSYTLIHTDAGSGTTYQFAQAFTAGSLVVALLSIDSDTETITGVSDPDNGSWSLAVGPSPGNSLGEREYIYYKWNVLATNPVITVVVTGGANANAHSAEFGGGPTSADPIDKTTTGSGGGAISMTLSSVSANALVVARVANSGSNVSPGSAFTALSSSGSFNFEDSEYLLDQGASGNRTVDFSTGGPWTAAAASFKLTFATAPILLGQICL